MTLLAVEPSARPVGAQRPRVESGCGVEGCGSPRVARGWCSKHYQRWRKHGDPTATVGQLARKPIDLPGGERVCKKCGKSKPLNAFAIDKHSAGGRRATCSACRNSHMAAYYAQNAERIKRRMADYRELSPDAVRDSERRRYERHRDRRIEIATEQAHTRRARLAAGDVDRGITQAALRARDGDQCRYCSREMVFIRAKRGEGVGLRANIDHVIPIARGGTHTWGNVVLACRDCNYAKGAKSLDEWHPRPREAGSRQVVPPCDGAADREPATQG